MEILTLIVVVLISIISFIAFYLGYQTYTDKLYFQKNNVHYAGNGTIKLLLHMYKGSTISDMVLKNYKQWKAKNLKIVGSQDFALRTYTIMDTEWTKYVLVKDFDYFPNRRQFDSPKNDVLFRKMLISLRGDKWKNLRSKLSPTFTTGKIKKMYDIFNKSGAKFVNYIEEHMKASPDGEIDLTTAYSKLTMDIIASAACAMDSQAFDDIHNPSIFEQMGKKLQINFGGGAFIKLLFMIVAPKRLTELLGLSFFDVGMQNFFNDAIKTTIHQRKSTGDKRDDFIQLMLSAREGQLKLEESELNAFEKDAIVKPTMEEGKMSDLLDDDGIVANCVLFILAGFDTTQSLLLFCAYSLALNQDVQDKLREEINEVLERNGGKLTYDGLQGMTYLDMVINETLRYYPPAAATDRECLMDYKIPGTEIIIKKGDGVAIPIYGIHHDEEYYPNPEKFDPERFSAENKSKINPYTFLPFGQGPRNCIGMRFALTEVKLAISEIVHNFSIQPSGKTLIPMKFDNTSSLRPKGGMWLALNKIDHNNL